MKEKTHGKFAYVVEIPFRFLLGGLGYALFICLRNFSISSVDGNRKYNDIRTRWEDIMHRVVIREVDGLGSLQEMHKMHNYNYELRKISWKYRFI